MKTQIDKPQPSLATALKNLYANGGSKKDCDFIAEALYPLARGVKRTKLVDLQDGEDIGHLALIQMIPRGILKDQRLRELVSAGAPEDKLLARLKSQFYIRLRCRAIDDLRRQKIRWASPLNEDALAVTQADPRTLPAADDIFAAIECSPDFTADEKRLIKGLIHSRGSLRKAAHRMGISRAKTKRLFSKMRLFIREEFGLGR